MYKKAGIKYSYSVHLRDTGTVRPIPSGALPATMSMTRTFQYGFNLPAEWIRPVGEETAAMIRSLAEFITKPKRTCRPRIAVRFDRFYGH